MRQTGKRARLCVPSIDYQLQRVTIHSRAVAGSRPGTGVCDMSKVNSCVGLPPRRVVDGYAIAREADGGYRIDLYQGCNILQSLYDERRGRSGLDAFPTESAAHAVARRLGYRQL